MSQTEPILFVGKDSSLRSLLERDFTVLAIGSWSEAAAVFEKRTCGAVVWEAGGLKNGRFPKEFLRGAGRLPVVVLAGGESEGLRYIREGAEDFLLLEEEKSRLPKAVRAALARRQARSAREGSHQGAPRIIDNISTLLDNIPAYVFWKDRNSVFLGCNRALASVLGLNDPSDIVGKTDYDFSFKKEEADFYRECDRRVMEGDEPMINIEETQHRDDGSERVLLTNKMPLKDERGQTVGMLGIFTDITDLKNAERELKTAREQLFQSEKMAAIGQLSAGIAHEIKNPLAIIQLSVEQLTAFLENADERCARMLEMIRTATQRANKVIGELLDFSRSSHVEFKNIDISSVVKSAVALVQNRTWDKDIQFVYRFSSSKENIKGDPILLEQVLVNLLNNSIDSIGEFGQVELKTYFEKKKEKQYVAVELRDTGAGMPEDVLNRIFEPFFTTKDQGKGTGLGLTIAYQILQQHGGFMEVESREKRGTICRVYIPAVR